MAAQAILDTLLADMLELLESDLMQVDVKDGANGETLMEQLPEELQVQGILTSYISEADIKQYLIARGELSCLWKDGLK